MGGPHTDRLLRRWAATPPSRGEDPERIPPSRAARSNVRRSPRGWRRAWRPALPLGRPPVARHHRHQGRASGGCGPRRACRTATNIHIGPSASKSIVAYAAVAPSATGTLHFTAVPPSILPDRPPRSHPERTCRRDGRHLKLLRAPDNLEICSSSAPSMCPDITSVLGLAKWPRPTASISSGSASSASPVATICGRIDRTSQRGSIRASARADTREHEPRRDVLEPRPPVQLGYTSSQLRVGPCEKTERQPDRLGQHRDRIGPQRGRRRARWAVGRHLRRRALGSNPLPQPAPLRISGDS